MHNHNLFISHLWTAVTHPSNNQAQCRATTLIRQNVLSKLSRPPYH